MLGLFVPPMGGWAKPWSGDAVFQHDDDALERIAAHLKARHAVSVSRDSVGRHVVSTAERSNLDKLVLGVKATRRKTDTLDTVSMDAYEASPGMSFAEFLGIDAA